ncbi:MBL fold metallo-hydrolase [uncultured Microbacterium sp.]|uniref:MBL fold metallo-hydrolase n=1 Tax=uncultured Microbacterium sp. TaxID=191216 RepID=UPI0030F87704
MAISSTPIDPSFASDAEITLWWLGQAGFALRSRDRLLMIDPYLSDVLADKYAGEHFPHRRLHDAPVQPAQVTGLDLVLCTHGHTDHMDLGTLPLLQLASDPLFVVPRAESTRAIGRGVPLARLLGMTAGETFGTGAGISITAVPAAHEERAHDAHGQEVFLGYVIDVDGYRIYHSGDCAPYDGIEEILRELDIDLALLPVNGRDPDRNGNGVPGNFRLDEAVALCRSAGIPRLIVHHWGLFAFNSADPDDLARDLAAVDDIKWTIPRLGEPIEIERMDAEVSA